MKKLFSAIILCTAILCGCSAKGVEDISETSVPEASSVTVTAESSATTVTETETTTTITTATAAEETTGRKPTERKIFITPIPSEEPFEVMSCKITNNIMNTKEEDFPDKEALKLAKEICFADEEIRMEIDENNSNAENVYYEYAEAYRIKSAEDIMFDCGCTFDFDSDGEDESLISLRYVQRAMGSAMYGNILIYIDGSEYKILEKNIGDRPDAKIITAGEYVFLLSSIGAGAIWYCYDIYSFESGLPEKVTVCDGAKSIYYQKGVFYCEIKFMGTYPFVLCEDGKFRQFGREKITLEDFEAHVENGGTYLDRLAEIGDEVTDIYTYGHYNYELCGEDFCYIFFRHDGNDKSAAYIPSESRHSSITEEIRFTDEVIYGGDVWAVKPVRNND